MSYRKLFSQREKAELFDKIAENFYCKNFGTFNKAQIDLLMFSIYIEQLIKKEKSFDDYDMSKELGISQTQVRNLKKKKQLVYPIKYDWKQAFLKYCKYARLDHGEKIVISIPDPDVQIELQHAIEMMGGYVELQLNEKVLKIPAKDYIDLILSLYNDDNKDQKKQFVKLLNERYRKEKKLIDDLTEKDWKEKIGDFGIDLAFEVLANAVPGGKMLSETLNGIKKLFEKE